jgi:hypothetical protein
MLSDERTRDAVTVPADGARAASTLTDADDDALDPDDVFHLLQNQRRRYALQYLDAAESDTVRMRDLADQVAAWEHDTAPALLTSRQRQRVYIPLYQNHLPKLASEGVIDYQQGRGLVTRLDAADQLDRYLRDVSRPAASDAPERRWNRYYLATALAGAALLAGVWVDLGALTLLPDGVAGVVVVASVALVALVQTVTDREML